jgi:hypothetical protein
MTYAATPEGAALRLLEMIAWAEGKNLCTDEPNYAAPKRDWILTTYAQCLCVVKDYSKAADDIRARSVHQADTPVDRSADRT